MLEDQTVPDYPIFRESEKNFQDFASNELFYTFARPSVGRFGAELPAVEPWDDAPLCRRSWEDRET